MLHAAARNVTLLHVVQTTLSIERTPRASGYIITDTNQLTLCTPTAYTALRIAECLSNNSWQLCQQNGSLPEKITCWTEPTSHKDTQLVYLKLKQIYSGFLTYVQTAVCKIYPVITPPQKFHFCCRLYVCVCVYTYIYIYIYIYIYTYTRTYTHTTKTT